MSFMNSKAPNVLAHEAAQSPPHGPPTNTNDSGKREGQSPIRKA